MTLKNCSFWYGACAAAALLSSAGAQAQELDGKFPVADPALQAFYQAVAQEDPAELDKPSAQKLVQLMFADGKLASAEKDQLAELKRADQSQVLAVIGSTETAIPTANDTSRAYINILFEKQDLNVTWAGDERAMERLVDMHRMAPGVAANIEKFLANKLYPTWRRSTIYNAFGPIREELKAKHDLGAKLPDADSQHLDQILYNSILKLKEELAKVPGRDPPPPFLYNWLNREKRANR